MRNFTGLGNYSRGLIAQLCQQAPQNEYLLFAPEGNEGNERIQQFLKEAPLLRCLYAEGAKRYIKPLWRSWLVSKEINDRGVDIYHGLSGELPLNIGRYPRIKSVVTIHDLIFESFPQFYHRIDRYIYTYKMKKACETADRVIAVSQCTKRDIMSLYGIPEEKIDVVYQGCDPAFTASASAETMQEVKARYNLEEGYILYVGTIEERKNALLAVKAMKEVKDRTLVLAGRATPYSRQLWQAAEEMGIRERIRMLHDVPFSLLPALYQMAAAFVYPSRYEGFGIPILEALNSNVPVVACTGSCLEEAGGPDSLYVHPDDVREMAQAVNSILENPDLRRMMTEKGLKWAERFSKEHHANGILQVYDTICK